MSFANTETASAADIIALNAARELGEALEAIGIALPSLRAEANVNGVGFVNLGGCPADAAYTLAHWIRDHA
ncbi:hypothetical protein [Streptomyces sp. G-G2]|uniref:hypothetical protein n=1 Tax=Streptomyces sp. G-G2 TaxID=3046201 RepID=UPI0024BA0D16|nr:hypothetical protein [Streptomyces sp. G-G2]MDJ0383156.1 hypothetical protein [Streptomyces sp. G-G2]